MAKGIRAGLLGMLCMMLSSAAIAQVTISGMVIDSTSFKSLPNVHIHISNKALGAITDEQGRFSLKASPFDTLSISIVGYVPVTFPVLVDQEDILIMMTEDVTYLTPIVVTGAFIRSPLIRDRPRVPYRRPKAAKLATGSGIAFDYFSRAQRELRKLQQLIIANEKVSAYNRLVTNPDFKKDMTERYGLSDDAYYKAILSFNQTRIFLIEYKTVEEVMAIMNDYFCQISNHCP